MGQITAWDLIIKEENWKKRTQTFKQRRMMGVQVFLEYVPLNITNVGHSHYLVLNKHTFSKWMQMNFRRFKEHPEMTRTSNRISDT